MCVENIINQVEFSDTLLREGRQSAGFHLSPDASMEYAKLVAGMKMDYIELTHPASSPSMFEQVQRVNQLNLGIKVATHVRLNERDVNIAINTGVKNINTYVPMNPTSPQAIGQSLLQAEKDIARIANSCSNAEVQLRVSVEHAFSLPLEQLAHTYKIISHTPGVHRVGIAETTGLCFPWKFQEYIETVYEVLPEEMPLQIHLHNDMSAAQANFLTMLQILARNGRSAIFDITPGGFGERNGILSYGDVFSALYKLNSQTLMERYKIQNYAGLIRFVQEQTGLPISSRDPLNATAFIHSAGPHVAGMINNNASYQGINPVDFGFTAAKLNVGHAVTGYQGILHVANQIGVELSEQNAKQIAAAVREDASNNGPFSDEKLHEIIRNENGLYQQFYS